MVLRVRREFPRQNFSKNKRREFRRLVLSGVQNTGRIILSCGTFPWQLPPRHAQIQTLSCFSGEGVNKFCNYLS